MGKLIGRVKDVSGKLIRKFSVENMLTDQGVNHVCQAMLPREYSSFTDDTYRYSGSYMGLVDASGFGGFDAGDRALASTRSWTEMTSYSLPNWSGVTGRRAASSNFLPGRAFLDLTESGTPFDESIWTVFSRSDYACRFTFDNTVSIAGFFTTNIQTMAVTFSDSLVTIDAAFLPTITSLISTAPYTGTFNPGQELEVIYYMTWKAAHRTY